MEFHVVPPQGPRSPSENLHAYLGEGLREMRVSRVDVWVVEISQVPPVAPYSSHLRTSSTTRSAICRLQTESGLVGWGEHNVNFLPDLHAGRLAADARAWLVGRSALDVAAFHRDCPLETRLRSGLEMALWDLRGQAMGQPLAVLLGGYLRREVELAACMGVVSYERARELGAFYAAEGYTTLKTKGGVSIESDVEIARGVRDGAGSALRLRIDPNRAYSVTEAAALARRLEPFDLEYLEQPSPAEPLDEAVWLRAQSSTPIALNESVTDARSAWEILRRDAAAVLLPDTPQAGGIQPCVEIGALCAAAGVPAVMHCGHDLGLKTAAMLHVAAACPAYCLANDSTYYGLADDILTERIPIARGRMRVPTGPGLGVTVDPERVLRYRIDD